MLVTEPPPAGFGLEPLPLTLANARPSKKAVPSANDLPLPPFDDTYPFFSSSSDCFIYIFLGSPHREGTYLPSWSPMRLDYIIMQRSARSSQCIVLHVYHFESPVACDPTRTLSLVVEPCPVRTLAADFPLFEHLGFCHMPYDQFFLISQPLWDMIPYPMSHLPIFHGYAVVWSSLGFPSN